MKVPESKKQPRILLFLQPFSTGSHWPWPYKEANFVRVVIAPRPVPTLGLISLPLVLDHEVHGDKEHLLLNAV